MIGQTISHYKILEKLGEGGMGVVYKAEDTKLDRLVALKFLPPHLAASEQDKARFIQEAKAASAINHPNICTIYSIDEHENQMFIIMEFVDGQTLRQKKESIGYKQAIDIGIQIADGLAAAHEKGIVHRDIKPENIMIRKDGIAQIMDFGLAKLRASGSKITRLTKEGSTVGTAGYMSPEQVQGQDADHRSDIFSYGVLLYELLTGQLPFKGVHETALAYEIVNVDPAPMSSLKPDIDPSLDGIVLECLEKDINERAQGIKQISVDLKRYKRESSRQRVSRVTAARPAFQQSGVQPVEVTPKPTHGQLWKWGAILFFLATAGLLFYIYFGKTVSPKEMLRVSLLSPEKTRVDNEFGGIALSTDGKTLAFLAHDSAGKGGLWIRPLDALLPQMLPGTENAGGPIWSPDGKAIAFFADGKLKKINLAGGVPVTLCDAGNPRGGSWSEEGIIIFTPDQYGGISQVSASGGTPTPVTKPDSAQNEDTHRWPSFLPDGRHFLFLNRPGAKGGGIDSTYICIGSIDSKDIKRLIHGVSNAVYANGYMLFVRESALMAQPFELGKLEMTGEAVPIVDRIQLTPRFNVAQFSVSSNGRLVYKSTETSPKPMLALFDNNGKQIDSLGEWDGQNTISLSRDGQRMATDRIDDQSRNTDLWLYDFPRHIATRFTFNPARDFNPLWSPNGDRIVFSSARKTKHTDLYVKGTSGSSQEELLTNFVDQDKYPEDWSADGRYVLFTTTDHPKTKNDLWILPMVGERKPIPWLQTEFNEQSATFSPDMRWIAYLSDESGKFELYVQPFIQPDSQVQTRSLPRVQFSTGGSGVKWRNDGRAFFYTSNDKLMMAEIRPSGANIEIVRVTEYFKPSHETNIIDLTSDGKRILQSINRPPEKSPPLTLVINWDEELRKK